MDAFEACLGHAMFDADPIQDAGYIGLQGGDTLGCRGGHAGLHEDCT